MAVVLLYKYKWKSRKFTNVERAIAAIKDINIADQQDDEIKKLLRTLVSTVTKAYQKLLDPNATIESDSDVSEDADPVVMLNQFLRESFFKGFKSQNREKFVETFKNIKIPDNIIETNTASGAVSMQGHQPREVITHPSPQEFPGGVIEMPDYDSNNDSKASATPVTGVTTQI